MDALVGARYETQPTANAYESKTVFYLKAALPNSAPETLARARKQLNALELTQTEAYTACVNKILREDLGFRVSAEADLPQLGNGEPIPMWSYGIVEYLMGVDLRDVDCLELGGGQSTLFLAKRCKSVTVIENNQEWMSKLVARNTPRVSAHFAQQGTMPQLMSTMKQRFQFISIDPGENRFACAKAAIPLLSDDGFIVLDNSEWYANTAAYLRGANLIQVDFHDFRPAHHYRTTTSLFLTPNFRPKPLGATLPLTPIGGRFVDNNQWDIPT